MWASVSPSVPVRKLAFLECPVALVLPFTYRGRNNQDIGGQGLLAGSHDHGAGFVPGDQGCRRQLVPWAPKLLLGWVALGTPGDAAATQFTHSLFLCGNL